MKNSKSTLLLILMFIIGLCILLYPLISNWWNAKVQTQMIENYESVLQTIDGEDYSQYFEAADAFNQKLLDMSSPLSHTKQLTEYEEILKVPNTDVMGYIAIDKLQLELPIYHGTSDEVLTAGVGHLKGSSVPVGGPGTHCALSAHRGLPSSKLFSDLDKLELGDLFTITVLDRLMTYQVEDIQIVLPKEVEHLKIDKDKDYVTLITCTPYGINTHRLLVRGTRVDNVKIKPQIYVPNEAIKIDPLIVAPIVAIPLLILVMIGVSVKYRKR